MDDRAEAVDLPPFAIGEIRTFRAWGVLRPACSLTHDRHASRMAVAT